MKVNLDWLDLKPLTRQDVRQHMIACQKSKDYLGNYLGWGIDAPNWNFREHAFWLEGFINSPDPFKSYVLYNGKDLIGFTSLSEGQDDYGLQICYWIRKGYQGQGLGTILTEMMIQKAFYVHRMHYVDLHIDVNNVASLKIPQKLGFRVVDEYQDLKPEGKFQSGKMQVWSLENESNLFRRPKEIKPEKRRFGWSQTSLLQARLRSQQSTQATLPSFS